jgi:putative acetyltransferase
MKPNFELANRCGIRCEWEVPDEAFMILVLDESEMQGSSGVARYRPEFSE